MKCYAFEDNFGSLILCAYDDRGNARWWQRYCDKAGIAATDWAAIYADDGPVLGEWESLPTEDLDDTLDCTNARLIASDSCYSSPQGLYFDRLRSAGWDFAEALGVSVTCPLCGEHVIAHKTALFQHYVFPELCPVCDTQLD